ncbi:MAG: glycosyltransferase, partial [Gammaproteobacteria bacterium]
IFFIARRKYDILMCHFGNTGNIGAFVKKHIDPDIRLICMFHGVDIRSGIEEGGSIYSDLFAQANEILSISSYNQRHLVRFGAPNIRHHAVGVNVDVCKKTDRAKPPGTPIHILTVARLVWEKGYKHAFDAVKLLKEEYGQRSFVYHVIGDGPLKEELQQYVRERGLSDVVIFEGELFGEEVHRHYQHTSLFLLPSIAEALPVVLMEAQAYEIPVVATDVGSVHEEIDDGKTGFLVPPANSGEIAKKLDWLLRHQERWAEMGKKGREKMKKEFNISKLNMELEDIFFKE